MSTLKFEFSFSGSEADLSRLDFYDAAQALIGFQRTLALTTHLLLNDEVITQAPSLRGADILVLPSSAGSWKVVAVIVTNFTVGTGFALTANRDTVLGHLVYSAYDYVISETLGFHVDFDESLGIQYQRHRLLQDSGLPRLDSTRFDSLIEKCEPAIRDMHRPIVMSKTASEATIEAIVGREQRALAHPLTGATYEYVRQTILADNEEKITGRVSSYNINTFRGRIYSSFYNRTIPFELLDNARTASGIDSVLRSMRMNARKETREKADLAFRALRMTSKNAYLKRFLVTAVLGSPAA